MPSIHPPQRRTTPIHPALRAAAVITPRLAWLPAILSLTIAAHADFQVLHAFNDPSITPRDGIEPDGSLLLSGTTLYGTTEDGGTNGTGAIFKYDLLTGNYSVIHSLSDAATAGQHTIGTLIQIGSTFYSTTSFGGADGLHDGGTIFKIELSGANYTDIHSFGYAVDPNNAWQSFKGIINSGKILYGTSYGGGTAGNGTVYKFDTSTSTFTLLRSFTAADQSLNNPDGGLPESQPLLVGSTLYGSTDVGGLGGRGTIFSLDTSGNNFTLVHSFSGPDGAQPTSTPVLSGNTLYGVTFNGGANPGISGKGDGALYKVDLDGSNFQLLHSFLSASDGRFPYGDLLCIGHTLYGMTNSGGPSLAGTLFQINIDGSNFKVLHPFTNGDDGGFPIGALIRAGDALYGLTETGGANFRGVMFKLQFPSLVWNGLADGASWNLDAANWTDGIVPNAKYADPYSVTFDDSAPPSARSIHLTIDFSPTSISINSTANSYSVSGAGSITGSGAITKNGSGVFTFAVPVTTTGPVTLNAGTLQFTAPGNALATISGPGNLTITAGASLTTDGLSITTFIINGAATIRHNSTAASKVASLILAGTPNNWSGKLDLTNNQLIVGNGGNIASQIRQAANLGQWNGAAGITSSSAQAAATTSTATALAYATGAQFTAGNGQTLFAGQPFSPADTLIMYTLAGDANMDRTVTFADFLQLQNHYNQSTTDWQGGDWNYDGSTTFADFLILQNNYNKSLGSLAPAATTTVPEPATLALLALILSPTLARPSCDRRGRTPR